MKINQRKPKVFSILWVFFFINTGVCQTVEEYYALDSTACIASLDSLRKEFATNKTIPSHLELESYIALSYFPELKNCKLEFKFTKIKTTLNVRPTIKSLLVKPSVKRHYIIRINNLQRDSVISFSDIPFNARVGLLGHEFSHIIDYRKRNVTEVIKRLFSYATKKSKAKYEKEIDSATIAKGLGWQLYDWSSYVLNESNSTRKYKKFKAETYLTPEEIKAQIKKSGL